MPDPLLDLIDRRVATALACGALQPIVTEQAMVEEGGLPFSVRWVSSLARKDAVRPPGDAARPSGFSPFLPPDPELTVTALGDAHLAVLNKFPVLPRHLLIVTRAFASQNAPLDAADFAALARVLGPLGGLGFYNGGTAAGASQPHKHLQWIPHQAGGPGLAAFVPEGGTDQDEPVVSRRLPWRHAFVPLHGLGWYDPLAAGASLHRAFARAWHFLRQPPMEDPMPPYNLLVEQDWLLVVPRSREHWDGVSVNALGFAGSLFVRHPEQIETIRAVGPLQVLGAVAVPRD